MTGCGDNLGDDSLTGDHPDTQFPVDDDGVVSKLIPEVCAARSWDEVVPTAKDVDLAVVQMPQGAGILTVPKAGGYLQGFLVDARGLIMGDPLGTKVRTDGVYTSVSASIVDSRLVVGLATGNKTAITVVRDDLGDWRELTQVDGNVIGDAPIIYTRGTRVTTTGTSTGLVTNVYDTAWSPVGTKVFNTTAPLSMTTAAYGSDAIVAWSTADECHLQRLAAGTHSYQPFPCKNSRLAMDFDARAGQMVYEAGDGIMLSNIRVNSHGEIANEISVTRQGTSPRVVFDGERYWVSYLNSHGDIVVGYLEDDNSLVSTSIEFTRPMHDAYEIAVINGALWVYSVDQTTGFGAHKMCLTR